MNRICIICNIEKSRNDFNTIGGKRPTLKHNCKNCDNIIYYYLYFKTNECNKYLNEIKLFLNNLISTNELLISNDLFNIINFTNKTYLKLNDEIKTALSNCVIYIGQTNNPKERHRNHIKHVTNLRLNSTISKYGIDNFYIHNIVRENKQDLDNIEIFSIASLLFMGIEIFNVSDGGEGFRGFKPTEEQKLKTTQKILEKKTIEKINLESKERGFIFLSTIENYTNPLSGGVRGIYEWKCINCGHERLAEYRSIISNYKISVCLWCSVNKPKIEQDYHNLATDKNLIWVGEKLPENIKQNTLWQCIYNKQHIRTSTFNAISNNTSPGCKDRCSILEILTFKQLEKYIKDYYLLNNKFPSCEAGEIKNTNLNWRRIDRALSRKYFPECIEYTSLPDIRKAIKI